MLLLAIVTTIFRSISILQLEDAPGSNISSAADALRRSIATVTTVGYGDHYPITPSGRLLAGTLMLTGSGVVGGGSSERTTIDVAPVTCSTA